MKVTDYSGTIYETPGVVGASLKDGDNLLQALDEQLQPFGLEIECLAVKSEDSAFRVWRIVKRQLRFREYVELFLRKCGLNDNEPH